MENLNRNVTLEAVQEITIGVFPRKQTGHDWARANLSRAVASWLPLYARNGYLDPNSSGG